MKKIKLNIWVNIISILTILYFNCESNFTFLIVYKLLLIYVLLTMHIALLIVCSNSSCCDWFLNGNLCKHHLVSSISSRTRINKDTDNNFIIDIVQNIENIYITCLIVIHRNRVAINIPACVRSVNTSNCVEGRSNFRIRRTGTLNVWWNSMPGLSFEAFRV